MLGPETYVCIFAYCSSGTYVFLKGEVLIIYGFGMGVIINLLTVCGQHYL